MTHSTLSPLLARVAAATSTSTVVAIFLAGAGLGACGAIEPALGPSIDDDADVTTLPEDSGVAAVSDGAASEGGDAGDGAVVPLVSFETDIRPLMNRSDNDSTGHGCAYCHYPGQGSQQGYMQTHLNLSTLGTLKAGGIDTAPGGSHPMIDVAEPEKSAIVQKLRGTFFLGARMPKSGPPYWSQAEIGLLVTWISQGAQGADSD